MKKQPNPTETPQIPDKESLQRLLDSDGPEVKRFYKRHPEVRRQLERLLKQLSENNIKN